MCALAPHFTITQFPDSVRFMHLWGSLILGARGTASACECSTSSNQIPLKVYIYCL